ncbi:hypothetical protein STXM2123_1075 [Streptomyces sp. F-3]|nr:hypothetical protein STXM2123_1075 [Streptomyces sp. F-3]
MPVKGPFGPGPPLQGGLLTTVSMLVENDCHERTTTPHTRDRGRGGPRPRPRNPLRLFLRCGRQQ